jgi:hypothetical protein
MKRHLASAFLVAVTACGGGATGLIEYQDPESLSLIRFPDSWHLYEQSELGDLSSLPFVSPVGELQLPAASMVAFDGAPSRDAANVTTDLATAAYPIGSVAVRTIAEAEKDHLSRFVLSQAVFPYANLRDAQEVEKQDFSFGEGYDGIRRLVAYTGEDGASVGVAYLIAVTDAADQRLFTVIAGCSLSCYTENQEVIEQVVDSWLVNTKG